MNVIAINNHKLHEVQMPLVPYSPDTISYQRYPNHRIQFMVEENNLILKIPVPLAAELYRQAILPQDQAHSVSIQLNDEKFGEAHVIDFCYGNGQMLSRELVQITFQKV